MSDGQKESRGGDVVGHPERVKLNSLTWLDEEEIKRRKDPN